MSISDKLTAFNESDKDKDFGLDARAIEYAIENIKQAKAKGKKPQFLQYAELAERETDPRKKMFLQMRMFHSQPIAHNLAMKEFRKDLEQGIYNASAFGSGEPGASDEYIRMNTEFSGVAKGGGLFDSKAFPSHNDMSVDPGKQLEVIDLISKIFHHETMDSHAIYLLATRLLLGIGRTASKGRGKLIKTSSFDVSSLMTGKLAKYFDDIDSKISDLMTEFNFSEEDITLTMILTGHTDKEKGIRVKGLSNKNAVGNASGTIEQAVHDLVGVDSFDKIRDLFLEGKDKKGIILATASNIMLGKGKVKRSDLITTLVSLVDWNIRKKSVMLKMTLFKKHGNNIGKIARELLKSANTEEGQYQIQNLMVAPVVKKISKAIMLKQATS